MTKTAKAPEWVHIPGNVETVREKSVRYHLSAGNFSRVIFIPTSQLKVIPEPGAEDILVAAWLPEKNNWPFIREKTA